MSVVEFDLVYAVEEGAGGEAAGFGVAVVAVTGVFGEEYGEPTEVVGKDAVGRFGAVAADEGVALVGEKAQGVENGKGHLDGFDKEDIGVVEGGVAAYLGEQTVAEAAEGVAVDVLEFLGELPFAGDVGSVEVLGADTVVVETERADGTGESFGRGISHLCGEDKD